MNTPSSNPLVILDTETTGLSADSGIVEIGIIDGKSGEILLQSLVNPWPHRTWNEAAAIHGITPEMVKRSPLIHDLWPAIFRIIQGADVVIYNKSYDVQFFPNQNLGHAASIHCAMHRYGALEGTRSHRGGYKWWKLTDASKNVGYDWSGTKAHRAIADCLATKAVWDWCEVQSSSNKAQAI